MEYGPIQSVSLGGKRKVLIIICIFDFIFIYFIGTGAGSHFFELLDDFCSYATWKVPMETLFFRPVFICLLWSEPFRTSSVIIEMCRCWYSLHYLPLWNIVFALNFEFPPFLLTAYRKPFSEKVVNRIEKLLFCLKSKDFPFFPVFLLHFSLFRMLCLCLDYFQFSVVCFLFTFIKLPLKRNHNQDKIQNSTFPNT